MKKAMKWFGLVFCLGLLMMAMTLAASAESTELLVGGVSLGSSEISGVTGTATYDPDTNTLTLKDYSYTGDGLENAAIYYYGTDTLNVYLVGRSTVTGPESDEASYGIYAEKGSLSFSGEGTLEATGGRVTSFIGKSYGVYTQKGSVTVEGGTLTAKGGEATETSEHLSPESFGVKAHTSVTVTGGSLTAIGGTANAEGGSSYGVYVGGPVTVTGGSLTAIGSDAYYSCGVHADTVTVSGGSLTATGGKVTSMSLGVDAINAVTVEGGTLTATGGAATSGMVTDDTVSASCGALAYGSVTVSGGTLTAIGGDAYFSWGVRTDTGSVTVSGGTLTATGGEATSASNGVHANVSVTVSGGTLTATGGTSALNKAPNDGSSKVGIYYWYWDDEKECEGEPREEYNAATYVRIGENYYDLWIGGQQFISTNLTINGGSGTATYDPDTKTLTLNNYSFTGESYSSAAIYYGGNDTLNVVLEGTSTVTGPVNASGNSYGIYAGGSLSFSGSGTLEATGIATANSYGVCAGYSVTVSGGTLTATGGAAQTSSYGVYVHEGKVTVSGGTLTATGGTAANSYGVRANSVTVEGGTLTAIGGTSALNNAPNDGASKTGIYYWYSKDVGERPSTQYNAATYVRIGENYYDLWIGGQQFISTNLTINGGSGTATFDPDTNTLTLNDYTTGTSHENAAIYYGGTDTLNVVLEGTSTVTGPASDGASYGIYAEKGSLSFSGTGILTATGGTAQTSSYGVYAKVSVDVSENGTLKATAGAATATENPASYGVYVIEGSVTVSGNGTLTAIGGTATGNNGSSCGVYVSSGSIEVKGTGKLEATGGNDSNVSLGVWHCNGSLTVSESGTLIATGGVAVSESMGLFVGGDLKLEVGTITATGGNASNGVSRGVSVGGNLTVSGNGTLTAKGGTTTNCDSDGVEVSHGFIEVTDNGKLEATGGDTTSGYSYGVYAKVSVDVSENGTLTATGGKATGGDSYGVYVIEGSVTVSGGELTATADEAANNSYGVYTQTGSVTVEGGTLTATGGNATTASVGVSSRGTIFVKGGVLNAIAGEVTEASGARYGVEAASLSVEGGVLNAVAGEVTDEIGTRLGVSVNPGPFEFTGGTLTVEGGVSTAPSTTLEDGYAVSYGASAENTLRVSIDRVPDEYYNHDYLHIAPTDENFLGLFLGGSQFSSACLTFAGKQGTATYDPDTNTLTLDGYVYGGPWNIDAALRVEEGIDTLTVILKGENVIVYDGVTERGAYGIYSPGDLVLTGDGALSVTGSSTCISVKSLVIENGVHLVANAFMAADILSVEASEVCFADVGGLMRHNTERFESVLDGGYLQRFEAVGKDHYTITAGDEGHTLTCKCAETSDIHLEWDYVHEWTYTHDPEAEHILHGDCGFCGATAKIVLVAPENPVYNGEDWEITVEIDHPSITVSENDLNYKPYRPHDAGEYTAVVTLFNLDGSEITVSVTYTVAKADLNMTEAPTLTVPGNVENLASISFNGGVVKDVLGNALPGVWVWEDGAITPENGKSYWADYVYSSANYNRLKVQFEVILSEESDDPEPNPNPGVGTDPGDEPEPDPNPGVGTEPDTETDTEPGTEPDTEPGTESDTEPGTEPDTEPGTEPDTEPGIEPDTEPDVEQGGFRSSGCGSALGSGAVILVGLVVLAGLALCKKED